jgi:CheY-specific phosphatase CheX
MARSLLGLHPTQDLNDQETGDAVSELMNIIAGKVKSRISERDRTLQLGLPMFVQGRIQETGSMERQAADLEVGPVTCHLLVYRTKRPA